MKNKNLILAGIVLVATAFVFLLHLDPQGVRANMVLSEQLQASNAQTLVTTREASVVSAVNVDIANRDAKRISDLQQIQNGLRLYFAKCGFYPVAPVGAGAACPAAPVGGAVRWSALTSALEGTPSIGIVSVPNDPTIGVDYLYGVSVGGTGYVLGAALEDAADPSLLQSAKGVLSGVYCGGSVYCVRP
jgi:hypothetical protein